MDAVDQSTLLFNGRRILGKLQGGRVIQVAHYVHQRCPRLQAKQHSFSQIVVCKAGVLPLPVVGNVNRLVSAAAENVSVGFLGLVLLLNVAQLNSKSLRTRRRGIPYQRNAAFRVSQLHHCGQQCVVIAEETWFFCLHPIYSLFFIIKRPPSMRMFSPVMKAALSEARYMIRSTIS